jgi:hypothetical protein
MVRTSLLVTVLFVSFVASAGAADPIPAPRVRMRTRALESLFMTALDRSPTFEAIVRKLEASDLIVYVDRSTRLPLSIRGGIAFRGAGAGVRYLDVLLNPRYTRHQMIAVLGHELQHAVEVARAPHVTSVEAFSRHYHHVGVRGASDNWDTPEAQQAGRMIARELTQSGRETLADSDAGSGTGRPGKSGRKGRRADEAVSQVPHAKCASDG